MDQQLTLFDDNLYLDEVFIEAFDKGDVDNENEEDLESISPIDLSAMAISGTDWTTETIVSQIRRGRIILNPSFQRRDAWTKKAKSRFIESIILGFPIPQIILAENSHKKGTYIVIDGKQRLLSIMQFVLGDDETKQKLKLTDLDIRSELNGLTYTDLQEGRYSDVVDAFDNQTIRTVVVKNWPSVQMLYLLFLRLNTGSVKLSPQELRQALYPGDFTIYINSASSKSLMLRQILNITKPDFRMRDVEIMLRYLGFHYYIENYSGSMQMFLDYTCGTLNKLWINKKEDIEYSIQNMESAIAGTYEIFGSKNAFRKFKDGKYESRCNRAVIDIMLFYFANEEVLLKAKEKRELIKASFEDLCKSDSKFLESFESTTKSISAVKYRVTKWGFCLNELLDANIDIPNIGS